ncbi:hypothetical protein [Nocardiopsis dassonvillei]|uniref:hypothetical protein n=1 Tax=Nocardiopsis dassonvillei TaxID=2014 RepID=UPI003638EE51
MKNRSSRPPRRPGTPDRPHQIRTAFEEVRWQAAQRGLVLTRERRMLGAVYTLTSLDTDTTILHDLGEVRAFLDRPS